MTIISANELKTKGVSAIQSALDKQNEVVISVRGKQQFVVVDIAHYNYLRECELSTAIIESEQDLAEGKFVEESAEDHVARLESMG